ncbi:MAG: methyl-accepting chemotaxis protein [Alteromonadaceae bacterium]|jgi:methyl-accepting chemotaxis protein
MSKDNNKDEHDQQHEEEHFTMPDSDKIESGVPFNTTPDNNNVEKDFNQRLNQAQQQAQASQQLKKKELENMFHNSSSNILSGMTIKQKLVYSLSTMTLIILILGLISYISIVNINNLSKNISNEHSKITQLSEDIRSLMFQVRDTEKDFLLLEDQSSVLKSARLIQKMRVKIEAATLVAEKIKARTGGDFSNNYINILEETEEYQQQFEKQVKDIKQARLNFNKDLSNTEILKEALINEINAIGNDVRNLVNEFWIVNKRQTRQASIVSKQLGDQVKKDLMVVKETASKVLRQMITSTDFSFQKDKQQKNVVKNISDAADNSASTVAASALEANNRVLNQTNETTLNTIKALRLGQQMVQLSRGVLDIQVQVARYLQLKQQMYISSTNVAIDESIDIAEIIRNESKDDSTIVSIKLIIRALKSYQQSFVEMEKNVVRVDQKKLAINETINKQKTELQENGKNILAIVEIIATRSWNNIETESRTLEETGKQAQSWLLAIVLIGATLGVAMLWLVPRPIVQSISQLLIGAQNVASGDLTHSVKVDSNDEMGQLANSFDDMRVKLLVLVDRIKLASVQISTTVNEISAAANQQSSTANEQTSSLNMFVGTITSISQTSIDLAELSKSMSADTRSIADDVNNNNTDSKLALSSMTNIGEATRQTSERIKSLNDQMDGITDAVDSIASVADQTTLLSLNAAIEANKAGELGKGFSVVATEIRRLSERSTDSATGISQMVRDIQRSTESSVVSMDKSAEEIRIGINLVEKSTTVLLELNVEIDAICQQIQDISTRSVSQEHDSVNAKATVNELLTSANVAAEAARQTSSAAQELSGMSAQLSDAISSFKTR